MQNLKREFQTVQEAEKELKKLETILDNAYGFLYIVDAEGWPICYSDGAHLQMGISDEEMRTTNVKDYLAKGITDQSAATADTLLQKKTIVKEVRTKVNTKLLLYCRPCFDENGELTMVVSSSQTPSMANEYIGELSRRKAAMEHTINYMNGGQYGSSIVCEDPVMRQIYEIARRVAQTESFVLITGESGTGKDVLASYIHGESKIKDKVFIPVNCAAIPSELLESEFFGYQGGAFTGASKTGKPGIFEMANGGTLFLDEVAELPFNMQSKLLRVLDSGEIKKIGSNMPVKTNVRIIAATNKNMEKLVEDGLFRADLYYRLNVVPLKLPPLRAHRADILPLADYFISKYNNKYNLNRRFSEKCIHEMLRYAWPGNIREMKNLIERQVIISPSDEIYLFDIGHLESENGATPTETQVSRHASQTENTGDLRNAMALHERATVEHAIAKHLGNYSAAARTLGISRTALYKKAKRLGIFEG
ncbi:MAG: sigma 54-interacting transcriptional regulator [Clostridiales Family XIII bacterium]|nr:sigma 54-interacting transcriptional regulator [Clostridiales Family XIII bacterium]